MKAVLYGAGWPPGPVRGARRPSHLRQQPRVSLGTACRSVTHDRTVARLSIAWTRQVTVTNLICGVDVSATTLEARVGRDGPVERFARNVAGIAALVTRLRQLTELRTAQANQRRLVTDDAALAAFDELLILITRQSRSLAAHIAQLIDSDPLWHRLDAAFRQIKGVADRTVARIMAEMPEIGTFSNKAAAKLGGLAPIARDSGTLRGKRAVRGGRSGVRAILFVVADVVRRYDPDFADCHRRLTQAGKPKKLIRVALARKLLVRLNAKARDVRRQLANAS